MNINDEVLKTIITSIGSGYIKSEPAVAWLGIGERVSYIINRYLLDSLVLIFDGVHYSPKLIIPKNDTDNRVICANIYDFKNFSMMVFVDGDSIMISNGHGSSCTFDLE